jgi:predicted nuclease with TOPRIM domain
VGLLKHGLGRRVQERGVSAEVLQGMEYTGTVRVMMATDMANINKRVDEVKEEVETMGREVDELSGLRQEVMELGAELTEARGEVEECRGAMMLMRNALTDVTREFQDFRAQWTEQREVLIRICSGLLGRLERVEGLVGPGSAERPIVIEDSEDSGNDEDMETAAQSVISLWARDVASTADNTLVENPVVYKLVPIEELTGSE